MTQTANDRVVMVLYVTPFGIAGIHWRGWTDNNGVKTANIYLQMKETDPIGGVEEIL